VIAFPGWPQRPSLPFPERCAGALRRIVLLNPPHTAIGSRIPREHLPPLGLLSIGGPLIDAGFDVHLVDAEFGPLPADEIVRQVARFQPDVVMLGHSGSSSAHETVIALCTQLKAALPGIVTVYGGVHPTYHFDEICATRRRWT
jgi:anaerobic magnesium-protoporphyrin IX monomethyl ester cyclase